MDNYIGEIRLFAGNFAPNGWMFCNGQLLPISEYESLFMLIGTTYGGDGERTFGLPDLRGRLPLHRGPGHPQGMAAGVEEVTLTVNQIPGHAHPLLASGAPGVTGSTEGQIPAADDEPIYTENVDIERLHPSAVGPTGGSQPHSNLMPYTCVNFIISLYGAFPSPG